MSEKITSNKVKPSRAELAAQLDETVTEKEDLEEQPFTSRKAAAAGAADSRLDTAPSVPQALPAQPPPAAKPLTPLAALWPSQTPAAQVQKAPIKIAAPTTTPAPAAQPAKSLALSHPATPLEPPVALKAPQRVKVNFVLLEPDAKNVALSGDFNGWSREGTAMARYDDGRWGVSIPLAPGRYEYKFIVDGEWIPDPLAHEYAWNLHGTLNSILEVRG